MEPVPPPQARMLTDIDWEPSYSHEDGDLVCLFFVPVLQRAKLYQRATGYFNAGALARAAEGITSLVERGGSMQLLVGCTLEQQEVDQIEKGYDIRQLIAERWKERLQVAEEQHLAGLGHLARLVAGGFLDVKVALPVDQQGRLQAGHGLYHAKMGIVTDEAGNQLVFKGSINETEAGWVFNRESFEVNCSWRGEERRHVEKSVREFKTLWEGHPRATRVYDFSEALREELLKFLPKTDASVRPPPEEKAPEPPLDMNEKRREVWGFLGSAAARPDGAMVAVVTSAVTPWPHQLRAYKRMLDAWPARLLVAEEVGLGKTVEAGLIIRHLWISGKAKRILILAPQGVLTQWQNELYEKFNLLVPIYTGHSLAWREHHFRQGSLEDEVARDRWTQTPLVLASSQLMRRTERQSELLNGPDWDLIVLDEAHHARRKGAGSTQEKGANLLLRLMQGMQAKTAALLLLTATPMQVHPVEIWDLLKLVGLPDEWTASAFIDYFAKLAANPTVEDLHALAKQFQVTERATGAILSSEVAPILKGLGLGAIEGEAVLDALRQPKTTIPLKRLSTTQRKAAIAILKAGSPVRHRMIRHTRALLREYFKRGLLAEPIAERVIEDRPVEMTAPERAVYDAVEDYISDVYQAASPDKKTAVGFLMTVYRRRVASSFYALKKTLEDRWKRLQERDRARLAAGDALPLVLDEDLSQDERVDEIMDTDDASKLEAKGLSVEERDKITEMLKSVTQLGPDTKARVLVEWLQEKLGPNHDSAIVFTQYTDTLDFLREFLADRLNVAIGCFSGRGGEKRDASGTWTRCSKEEIKRRLRDGSLKVVVCTDAAGEGLNLQSCGILVNFDLPWNPMKVEQRIGRIDRIGQKHDKVLILNLAYKDTVEADVYFALSTRISLFNGVVGKLQPILARLPREFENVSLAPRADREKLRHQALTDVTKLVKEAQTDGFDIDEASEADLTVPAFPPPPLTPADVERTLASENLLPSGVEARKLDGGSWSLAVPGLKGAGRVTTLPGLFDEHTESLQLFLPGGALFDRTRKMVDPSA